MRKEIFIALSAVSLLCRGQIQVDYEAGVTVNAGDGDFAPHYILSGRGGTVTQPYSTLIHAGLSHRMDTTVRVSWGAGAEVWGGWSSSTDYYNLPLATAGETNSQHPARAWLQQLYAEGKYRGAYVVVGQKEHHSALLNESLSSGDLTMSNNSRPMPGVQAGFVNFQNIPYTKGWVQIDGEIGYYRTTDGDWLENHYNEYNHFITTGSWLNYKNIYFRTKPGQRVVATVGLQDACQYGGTRTIYTTTYTEDGTPVTTQTVIKQKADFEAFFKAFIPGRDASNTDGDQFCLGNHVGSWDLAVDVTLDNAAVIRGYYQSPWDDGSGFGKCNGFDGLYGIEYKSAHGGIVSGAVIEYFDFTNQSGPIHWAPDDFEGTSITEETTGGDDYWNNYAYNGYQSGGLSIGSSMIPGSIYNTNGYMRLRDNMLRGFHAAVMGNVCSEVGYRLMGSYRKSWGTPLIPRLTPADCVSLMVEATYSPRRVAGLDIKAQFALDHGNLLRYNTSGLVSV